MLRQSIVFLLVVTGILCTTNASAENAKPQPPPTLPPGARLIPDIAYAHADGQPVLLDLYLPKPGPRPAPIIVAVHGGGWIWGDRHIHSEVPLVADGYALASIDYRLAPGARWPAQIYDCKAAVRWLRAHAKDYHLDGDHIGAWGASAGGHLVAMLGTSGGVKELEGDEGNPGVSSRVQAVCDWFGPADLVTLNTHHLYKVAVIDKQLAAEHKPPSVETNDRAESFEGQLLGGAPDKLKALAIQASPITYARKDNPPFLIMHGDADWLLPLGQSKIMDKALKDAGVDVTFEIVHGAGHGFSGPVIMDTMRRFFDRHLKKI